MTIQVSITTGIAIEMAALTRKRRRGASANAQADHASIFDRVADRLIPAEDLYSGARWSARAARDDPESSRGVASFETPR